MMKENSFKEKDLFKDFIDYENELGKQIIDEEKRLVENAKALHLFNLDEGLPTIERNIDIIRRKDRTRYAIRYFLEAIDLSRKNYGMPDHEVKQLAKVIHEAIREGLKIE